MKIKLQKPALLAAVSYIVLAFFALLPTKIVKEDGKTFQPSFTNRVFMVLMMLIPFGLSVYSLNCQIVGKCWTWTYIQSIGLALWVILFVTATIFASNDAKEQYRNRKQ